MQLASSLLLGDHELGVLEYTEMLHDAETAHVGKNLAQLTQASTIAIGQGVEEDATARIGQRLEDEIVDSRVVGSVRIHLYTIRD